MTQTASKATFEGDLAQFHSDECQAILDKYKHIERLIGLSSHSSTEGHYCEILIRDVLRRVLPRRYGVSMGFVRGSPRDIPAKDKDGNAIANCVVSSPELDVLIHDQIDYSPVFETGELAVVLPEAVHGVIQVKKTLTAGELGNALKNLYLTEGQVNNQTRLLTSERVFWGVFAFSPGIKQPNDKRLSLTYRNAFSRLANEYKDHQLLPNLVVEAGGHAILKADNAGDVNKAQIFKCYRMKVGSRDYSLQLLLWALMRTTEMPESKTRVNRFSFPDKCELVDHFEISMSKRTK